MAWQNYDAGRSVGQRGSEGGAIVRDEEHAEGARITIEERAEIAPFSITCGVYGWTCHTRFFSTREEAVSEFERMKEPLVAILELIPYKGDPRYDERMRRTAEEISRFVERFP